MPANSCQFKIFCHAQNQYGSARNSFVVSRNTPHCNKYLKDRRSNSQVVLSKPMSNGITSYFLMARPTQAFESVENTGDDYCYDNASEPELKPAALKECCGKSSGSTLYKSIFLMNFMYFPPAYFVVKLLS